MTYDSSFHFMAGLVTLWIWPFQKWEETSKVEMLSWHPMKYVYTVEEIK